MNLSVIIPALNEARHLTAAIRAVRDKAALGEPRDIIVVDSGSTDGTGEVARGLGARLVGCGHNQGGRAAALNRGAESATGDVFLFLDADTLPPLGYDQSIKSVLEDPGVVGGAFEFALSGSGFALRLVELVNRVRYRIWRRYYGDQGVFVRAEVFRRLGGYPPRRILEASEFCVSLGRVGKLALIPKKMVTSPRRFVDGGVYTVLANDVKIWWLDLIGRPVDHYADAYWEQNRQRGEG
ncbi:MAG: glycosyltransferase family 2 protein [Thermodesulfobacteriota bacterium]